MNSRRGVAFNTYGWDVKFKIKYFNRKTRSAHSKHWQNKVCCYLTFPAKVEIIVQTGACTLATVTYCCRLLVL